MNSATTCILNYINGNLTDACRQARRVRPLVIYQALRARYNKSERAALAITKYLKDPSQIRFEEAAAAERGDVR